MSSKCVPGIRISEQRYLEGLAQNANRSQQAHAGGLSVYLGTNCLTSLVLSSEESSQFILLILFAPSASFSSAKEGTQSRRNYKGMNVHHFLNHISKPSGEWLLASLS